MTKTSMFVKLTFQPGTRPEGLAALERALEAAHSEHGTEVYSFHVDRADADVVWAFELYSDDEALGTHGQSPAVAELFGALGGLLAEPPMLVVADLHAGKGL